MNKNTLFSTFITYLPEFKLGWLNVKHANGSEKIFALWT